MWHSLTVTNFHRGRKKKTSVNRVFKWSRRHFSFCPSLRRRARKTMVPLPRVAARLEADCKNKSRVQRRRFSLNCINFNPFYCIAFFFFHSIVLCSPFDRIRSRPSRFSSTSARSRERIGFEARPCEQSRVHDERAESAYNKPWRERQSETKTGLAR